MVSGFLTSPYDHSRIFSGEASEIRMPVKLRGSFGLSKKLSKSFIVILKQWETRVFLERTDLYFYQTPVFQVTGARFKSDQIKRALRPLGPFLRLRSAQR